jgi:uncharacterized repeat protein (TIGR03803 family)
MGSHPLHKTWSSLLAAGLVAVGSSLNADGAAGELTTLAAFARLNGAEPYGSLLLTANGDLYGTTFKGGTNGQPFGLGTIFRVSSVGALTTLVSFNGSNGSNPYAGLAVGPDGLLYGTTWMGGTSNAGTVFRVSTNGLFTSLLSFTNGNGAKPSGRLVKGPFDYLYGTTQFGGVTNLGTVFRLTTNGVLTTLASFNGTNGANPYAEVTAGRDNHLYGTTVNGGSVDAGVIFRVTTNGALETLYTFTGLDGANPYGGLVQDGSGYLYGTTAYGGAKGYGTVFKITTNGVLTTLHSFSGGSDGANPWASLLLAADGYLYGTTILGGADTGVPRGTVCQLKIDGVFVSLVSFNFDTNGISPYASVVQGSAGELYGTTWQGGSGLRGTVFRLTPAPQILHATLGSGNTVQLGWDVWLGKQYQVQYCNNPAQPDWQNLDNPFIATNSPALITTDRVGPTRFFRVRMDLLP